jgi:hypothetical protein
MRANQRQKGRAFARPSASHQIVRDENTALGRPTLQSVRRVGVVRKTTVADLKAAHHAAALHSLSAPRITILIASSAKGRCSALASFHGTRVMAFANPDPVPQHFLDEPPSAGRFSGMDFELPAWTADCVYERAYRLQGRTLSPRHALGLGADSRFVGTAAHITH